MTELERIAEIPDAIRALVAGLPYTLDQTGMSGSRIALFDDMVLKAEPVGTESENNLAMLRWLDGRIPVPKVLHTEVKDGFRWLLMTRLEGTMSCDAEWLRDPQRLARALADAMKRLWAVDITDCPVDLGLAERLERAAEIECDMDNVDPETFGENGFSSPAALLDWLRENRPPEDRVLSHGDFCLPNIFLENWELAGFLDLGRCGVSDRWQDIALCWRSLRDNLGGRYGDAVPGFDPDCLFDALGVEKDEGKLRYYLLLDELF